MGIITPVKLAKEIKACGLPLAVGIHISLMFREAEEIVAFFTPCRVGGRFIRFTEDGNIILRHHRGEGISVIPPDKECSCTKGQLVICPIDKIQNWEVDVDLPIIRVAKSAFYEDTADFCAEIADFCAEIAELIELV